MANNQGATNRLEKSKILWGVLSAIGVALLSAIAAGFGSYYSGIKLVESARIPAQITASTNCITNENTKEMFIRNKSAEFMSSVGAFTTFLAVYPKKDFSEIFKVVNPAITQGYALSAFAPPKLASLAMIISGSIKVIIASDTSDERAQYAGRRLNEALVNWQSAFDEEMSAYESKRDQCTKTNFYNKPAS